MPYGSPRSADHALPPVRGSTGRVVERSKLGKSLRAWLTNMGIPAGGRSINDVREQAERISRCRLTFHIATGSIKGGLVNQNIVDTAMFVGERRLCPG